MSNISYTDVVLGDGVTAGRDYFVKFNGSASTLTLKWDDDYSDEHGILRIIKDSGGLAQTTKFVMDKPNNRTHVYWTDSLTTNYLDVGTSATYVNAGQTNYWAGYPEFTSTGHKMHFVQYGLVNFQYHGYNSDLMKFLGGKGGSTDDGGSFADAGFGSTIYFQGGDGGDADSGYDGGDGGGLNFATGSGGSAGGGGGANGSDGTMTFKIVSTSVLLINELKQFYFYDKDLFDIGNLTCLGLTDGTTILSGGTITTTGLLDQKGGRIAKTTRVTTTYTILATDNVVYADTDGGAYTVTLPAGVEGTQYKIINCGSSGNNLTVDGNGAETVFGNATKTVPDGNVIDLHYNATEGWW